MSSSATGSDRSRLCPSILEFVKNYNQRERRHQIIIVEIPIFRTRKTQFIILRVVEEDSALIKFVSCDLNHGQFERVLDAQLKIWPFEEAKWINMESEGDSRYCYSGMGNTLRMFCLSVR